jgi:hypothetical protein
VQCPHIRSVNNTVPILQKIGTDVHHTAVSIDQMDLIAPIIIGIEGIRANNVIELQTLVHGMPSIRLLLEGNREHGIRGVLLEIVEEKLVLLHGDNSNERGINDAISIANIILSKVKLVTV